MFSSTWCMICRNTRAHSHNIYLMRELNIYNHWRTIDSSSTQLELRLLHAPAMLSSRGPHPLDTSTSISSQVLPHPHEVARVLNTFTEISAASENIIQRNEVYIFLRYISLLIVVPFLGRKFMFTHRHIGQGTCPLRLSMERGYVAPSIHYSTTSQIIDDICAVSG